MAFFSRTLAATAVFTALALPVLAQSTAPAATTPPAAQNQAATPGERSVRHMPDRAKMQERMAQHQAQLKQKLELSAAQEPAWNTFIASMQPGERPARLNRLSPEEMQKLSTPERIERMRAQRAQRQALADQRADAVLAFYAALNPAQQKTFDAQTARHMGHMGHKGHMDHMGNKGHKGHMHGGHGMDSRDGGGRWERHQHPAAASPQ